MVGDMVEKAGVVVEREERGDEAGEAASRFLGRHREKRIHSALATRTTAGIFSKCTIRRCNRCRLQCLCILKLGLLRRLCVTQAMLAHKGCRALHHLVRERMSAVAEPQAASAFEHLMHTPQ